MLVYLVGPVCVALLAFAVLAWSATRAQAMRPAGLLPWAMSSALDGNGGGSAPAGSRERIRTLVSKPETRRAVRTWLLHLRVHPQDVDDLVQEVLRAAVASADRFDPTRGTAECWLNGLTRNVASKYRARVRYREVGGLEVEALDEASTADEALEGEEHRLGIRAAVLQLPAAERTIVEGHELAELPMASCAAAAGLPISSAYKARIRGLVKLRELLAAYAPGHRGGPLPTAAPALPGGRRR